MTLIVHVNDSNIIRRAGLDAQQWAADEARRALENDCDIAFLQDMNDRFVQKNISPGGSADLLAVTYFLHFLDTKEA